MEVGFRDVVEVSEIVNYDAVTFNFRVGGFSRIGLPIAIVRRADRQPPRSDERDCPGNHELRPPARFHESERRERTYPKRSRQRVAQG